MIVDQTTVQRATGVRTGVPKFRADVSDRFGLRPQNILTRKRVANRIEFPVYRTRTVSRMNKCKNALFIT